MKTFHLLFTLLLFLKFDFVYCQNSALESELEQLRSYISRGCLFGGELAFNQSTGQPFYRKLSTQKPGVYVYLFANKTFTYSDGSKSAQWKCNDHPESENYALKRELSQLQTYISTGCLQGGTLEFDQSTGQPFYRKPSKQKPGVDAYLYANRTFIYSDGSKSATWACNENASVGSGNSECRYQISIPVIKWQFNDNRKLCTYCRSRYSIYTKVDLDREKTFKIMQLMQIRMDKHLESIKADDAHRELDNLRLKEFVVKNFKADFFTVAGMISGSYFGKIFSIFNSDPEEGINKIDLYDVDSEFCSLKCQDDYRRNRF